MSEHDAHNALTATARMRALAEPVEDGKLMTFSERMYRAREARHMHETMRGEGHARAMVNNPVYRNQEIAAGMREAPGLKLCNDVADQVQRQIDAHVDALAVKAGWPDFREGRREYRLLPHEIAQQDGFPDNE